MIEPLNCLESNDIDFNVHVFLKNRSIWKITGLFSSNVQKGHCSMITYLVYKIAKIFALSEKRIGINFDK